MGYWRNYNPIMTCNRAYWVFLRSANPWADYNRQNKKTVYQSTKEFNGQDLRDLYLLTTEFSKIPIRVNLFFGLQTNFSLRSTLPVFIK